MTPRNESTGNPARPLRIALPTSSFLPSLGGVEVGLHNIASRLLDRGMDPVVIVPRSHKIKLDAEGWELPYPVESFPSKIWGMLDRFPGLGFWILDAVYSRFQRKYGFNFWHGTMGWPIGVSLVHWADARGIPHLVRCAGEDIQQLASIGYGARRRKDIDHLVRRWLPRAQTLVAITESVAAEYRALGVDDRNIVHIPNGVDGGRFLQCSDTGELRTRLGVSGEVALFLAVGRNHPKKDFKALVHAAASLRNRGHENFRLVIVGAGATRLAPLASAVGVLDLVHLREAVGGDGDNRHDLKAPSDSLIELYKSADCFVFPSLIETFGIVLVEAMAAGLPVITTDAPGCRDVVRPGIDGTSVQAGNVEALADGMASFIASSAEARRAWSLKSLRRARDFDWDDIVDKYISVYRERVGQ